MFRIGNITEFSGFNKACVFSRQSNRSTALCIDQADYFFVDQPTKYHLNDFHGFIIGNPHTINKRRFLTLLFQTLANLRPTTVNHDWIHSNQLHQHNITSKSFFECTVHHSVTTILYDQSFAMKTFNVRQCLSEDTHDIERFISR